MGKTRQNIASRRTTLWRTGRDYCHGVETRYGRLSGNFRVVDALSTLAFDYHAAPAISTVNWPNFSSNLRKTPIHCPLIAPTQGQWGCHNLCLQASASGQWILMETVTVISGPAQPMLSPRLPIICRNMVGKKARIFAVAGGCLRGERT